MWIFDERIDKLQQQIQQQKSLKKKDRSPGLVEANYQIIARLRKWKAKEELRQAVLQAAKHYRLLSNIAYLKEVAAQGKFKPGGIVEPYREPTEERAEGFAIISNPRSDGTCRPPRGLMNMSAAQLEKLKELYDQQRSSMPFPRELKYPKDV
jgi:hypothetical protein